MENENRRTMEKVLRKSGLYGLVFGLAVSILFVNYKEVQQVGDGGQIITYKSFLDYFITILRYGIIGMFLGLFIGWWDYKKKHKA